jgi:hypothetical protein
VFHSRDRGQKLQRMTVSSLMGWRVRRGGGCKQYSAPSTRALMVLGACVGELVTGDQAATDDRSAQLTVTCSGDHRACMMLLTLRNLKGGGDTASR